MSFRMVPKSVTLNDLERRNGPYFALFRRSGRKYTVNHTFCDKNVARRM